MRKERKGVIEDITHSPWLIGTVQLTQTRVLGSEKFWTAELEMKSLIESWSVFEILKRGKERHGDTTGVKTQDKKVFNWIAMKKHLGNLKVN